MTLYIESGSPWENGYVESFNGKLRDELLDREVFYTLLEVQVLTEQNRRTYNQIRPPNQAAQLLGLQTTGAGNNHSRRSCPSNGRTNIESGTTTEGRSEGRPPRLDLELYPHLPRVRVSATSAKDYMSLLSRRAARASDPRCCWNVTSRSLSCPAS
jgi:hypothetical protein